ncbi:hypothetical protein [Photobacterium kishitanii]|uniref:hypothetical protein n=1 Tax=Photobacterium kishitanii TaxID=318456 RepID=UPI0004350145|nr:hypothetical protein [Photobacterium kishitanii]CEO37623.1 hypothetical protein PPBDW_u10014 [Photobacterium kishitanii]
MPSFIVISSKKVTDFDQDARTVLESHRFSEVHTGTYMGPSNASLMSTRLKALGTYSKNKSSAGIKIYYGSLN